MPSIAPAERRTTPRYSAESLVVQIRRRGRLARLQGIASDFNRHGLAIVLDQPLPKDCTVYLSLTGAENRLENVIGVVHNCVGQNVGYRCGIQFRTGSQLQDDRVDIENMLINLEQFFKQL